MCVSQGWVIRCGSCRGYLESFRVDVNMHLSTVLVYSQPALFLLLLLLLLLLVLVAVLVNRGS